MKFLVDKVWSHNDTIVASQHQFVRKVKPEKQRITIIVSQVSSQTKVKKIQSMDEFQVNSSSLREFSLL